MAKRSIWKEETPSADPKLQTSERIEPFEKPGGRIDTFIQQNSPVNNEMIRNASMNNLYGQEIDGQLKIMPTEVTVREKHGNMKPVYSLCSFSYDDNADIELFNKHGRFRITGYDRRVYNAICTLFLNDRKVVSVSEIFSVMNGYAKTKPAAKQIQAIENAIAKLSSINVFIDLTEEVNAHIIKDPDILVEAGILKNRSDKIKKAVIEDKMMHCKIAVITSEQGKVTKTVSLVGEPSLLTYNRAKGTLLSIPMEYIGLTASNATDKSYSFQDYLLTRIIGYMNGKLKENKILYKTIYRDSGVDEPANSKDKIRDRDLICKLMKELKQKGLIADYEEVKDGRSYVGIVFHLGNKKGIDKK